MFTHNISPEIFSVGPISIRYYGLIYGLGFIAAYLFLFFQSKKGKIKITPKEIDNFVIYLIVGTIVGARLFEVIFWEPAYYFSNPSQILAIWNGGLSFHGGFVGVIIAGYLFSKKYGHSFWKLADIVSIPAIFMLALGRIANFINAELVGKVTDVSWCVVFPNQDGCRHPVQLYYALKRFIVFGWMYFLYTKNSVTQKFKDGFIFWNFVLFDNIGRFIVDFWKDDVLHFGLTMGQILSLVLIVVSIYFIYKRHLDDVKNIFK